MPSEKHVFVFAELHEGKLSDVSCEAVGCARQLAAALGGGVHAAVVGDNSREMAGALASYGADKIYCLETLPLSEYPAEVYTIALSALLAEDEPEVFLCGATLLGRELATRLAARLEAGLISDCTSLSVNEEGRLLGTRLTHGGRISSTIVCNAGRPQMATLKPGAVSAVKPETGREAEVVLAKPETVCEEPRITLKGVVRADPDKIGLDEAEVIIAGGKGMGGPDNMQLLEKIAGKVGGVVAGSLGAVDEGWLPHKKLVGQTGTTVTPRLYMACGISGSVYHVLGMRDSDFVIAVNKDPNAPVFKVADMTIIGDIEEIAPAIIERLGGAAGNKGGKDE